ncbi:FG-GAP repeat protein, partial [Candidatus Jidaibacter acanthamoeba]
MSFSNPFSLSELDGSNGFKINGAVVGGNAGHAVSSAGDINGDGIADLIIGAESVNYPAGASYVVFGSKTPFASSINVSDLDGSNGFRLNGASGDNAGISVSRAGDINGDGIDDLIIGAYRANSNAGASYVVFGSKTPFSSSINLSGLDGSNGFKLNGAASDSAGNSVSSAGDINGDGIDDLIIGAPNGNSNTGGGYVVFGSKTPFSSSINLSG